MTRTIKRKKYLFWFDFDDKVKVVEFRVCDCFLDQILIFRNKLNSVGEFTDDLKKLLFDNIPIIPDIADDIFFLFMAKNQLCVVKLHYINLITENLFAMVKCMTNA